VNLEARFNSYAEAELRMTVRFDDRTRKAGTVLLDGQPIGRVQLSRFGWSGETLTGERVESDSKWLRVARSVLAAHVRNVNAAQERKAS
jgi:hypothetical protein